MKCIIIEGPQGCGKTTLANYLRENLEASNLYRLTGNKDKTKSGKEKSKKMYLALLEYMKKMEDCEVNLIFDRTFFSDYVYAKLGYKEYDYDDTFQELLEMFGRLDYEMYYISLYLEDVNIYSERLKRVHHNYQAFSLESSVKQQEAYKKVLTEVKKLDNIKVLELAMDNFDEAYEKIDRLFQINNR